MANLSGNQNTRMFVITVYLLSYFLVEQIISWQVIILLF
jgi:hypothetical protein